MYIGRLKEANGISWRQRAPMVARLVLGDNISENTERTSCYATMITTHTFVYFQQSDASCVIGKIKGGNQSQLLLLFLFRLSNPNGFPDNEPWNAPRWCCTGTHAAIIKIYIHTHAQAETDRCSWSLFCLLVKARCLVCLREILVAFLDTFFFRKVLHSFPDVCLCACTQ